MPPRKPRAQTKEILPTTQEELAPAPSTGLLPIIERFATEPEMDPLRLEKLLEVYERWEANEARKRYWEDMRAFNLDPPKLVKDSKVDFETRNGGRMNYKYINLADIVEASKPKLAEHGFSFHWEPHEDGAGLLGMTCVLTHHMGHQEKSFRAAPADQSGQKNAIQSKASTHTYLQRYTLLDVTGLAAGDDDNDGNSFGGPRGPRDYDPAEQFDIAGAPPGRSREQRPPRQPQGQVVDASITPAALREYGTLLNGIEATPEAFNFELSMLDQNNAPRPRREVLWKVAKERGLTWDANSKAFVKVEPEAPSTEEIDQALDHAETAQA